MDGVIIDSAKDPLCGPIRAALITWIVETGKVNDEEIAQAFAKLTLQNLHREGFARDFRALQPVLCNEFVLSPLLAFQSLTQDEREIVLDRFFKKGPFITHLFRSLHATPYLGDQDEEAFWFDVLGPPIRHSMKSILR